MNPSVPFETVLQTLAMAYVASAILVLLASNICLAVIEIIEEASDK